jgi:hypothetical protein
VFRCALLINESKCEMMRSEIEVGLALVCSSGNRKSRRALSLPAKGPLGNDKLSLIGGEVDRLA